MRRGDRNGKGARGLAARLLLLLLLAMPAVAAAQPADMVADPELSFEVVPRGEWVDTGIDVAAGDRLVMRIAGEVVGMQITGAPIPTPADDGRPVPAAPYGALLGRIGDRVFAIGDEYDAVAEAGGRLALGVNTAPNLAHEVQGAYEVAVTRFSPPPPDPDPVANEAAPVTAKSATRPQVAVRPVPKAKRPAASEPVDVPAARVNMAWLWLVALAGAAALGLGLLKWRRGRLGARTRARLSLTQSLEAGAGGDPPPELKPAWPAVGTRWRIEEKEPAFAGWAGEEARDG